MSSDERAWVLTADISWGGRHIAGVYSSPEEGMAAHNCATWKRNLSVEHYDWRCAHCCELTPYEMNAPALRRAGVLTPGMEPA